jgi:hypothetical protein
VKAISQREARRLQKEVRGLKTTLADLYRTWGRDYPGVHILSLDKGDSVGIEDLKTIETARRLGHPVIVTHDGTRLLFYGVTV